MGARVRDLREHLRHRRSGNVVFLAHCLLNESTRYLGGAFCGGCVPEVVEACLGTEVEIVQMPCPEQIAWGGVLKRPLLDVFAARARHPFAYRLRRVILPLFVWYTCQRYRRLAPDVADLIAVYLASEFTVVGVIGIGGSPSCGVSLSLDIAKVVDQLANLSIPETSVDRVNAVVRAYARASEGIFIGALRSELRCRKINVPFAAHDLFTEMRGKAAACGALW